MINETKILELIRRQKETGLNITSFCANEGIAKSSYYYWRKRVKKAKATDFIPLLVKSPTYHHNSPAKIRGDDAANHTAVNDDFLLELIYPNGTRLRIKNIPDLDHIRSLVTLFG